MQEHQKYLLFSKWSENPDLVEECGVYENFFQFITVSG